MTNIHDPAGVSPAGVQMGTRCEVHTHTELVPIELHHVWPLGLGGPNTAANKISVCANAHYSIHAVLDKYLKGKGTVPDSELALFGPKVCEYALKGYTEWKAKHPAGTTEEE